MTNFENGGQNVKATHPSPGYVLPPVTNHALQGHPEVRSLWEQHIHDILVKELQFVPTTHENVYTVDGTRTTTSR